MPVLSEVELFDVFCQGKKAPYPQASCLVGFFDDNGFLKDEHDCLFEAELSDDKQTVIVRLEERRHLTFYKELKVPIADSKFLGKFEIPLTDVQEDKLLDTYRRAIKQVYKTKEVKALLRQCR